MIKEYTTTEKIVRYDPKWRLSSEDGGDWPHRNHYEFHEAVVAAHLRLQGYIALRDYTSTLDYSFARGSNVRPALKYISKLFHEIIGPKVSEFMKTELKQTLGGNFGQPDLFVFQAFNPTDPKILYKDPLPWFFAEVKGPDDTISDNQFKYWRLIAYREDLDLGEKRIRQYRSLPGGMKYERQTIEY